jgi:hypothetical protein
MVCGLLVCPNDGASPPRRVVHEQVRDKLDLGFMDKGEIELKNIRLPVQGFVIGRPKRSAQAARATRRDSFVLASCMFTVRMACLQELAHCT